ncbi:hypothetical protein YC2023_099040 [Brassica napus]
MPVAPHPVGSSLLGTLAPSSSSSSNDQPTKFHTSSSIKLKTTTNGGSETVAMKSLGLLYDHDEDDPFEPLVNVSTGLGKYINISRKNQVFFKA